MNERIKEIAEQAGMEDYPTHGINSLHGEQYISKFAELIIKECIKVSKETCNELKADESIHLPGFKTTVNLYNSTFRNSLAERFGVE